MLDALSSQTAGCSLTAQEPENNIIRTTIQALAGVLGGTQSLHTNSLDEALALPSDWAVRIALRTQQIIAHESGVTNSVDPLGGSYLVETMTHEMEQRVLAIFAEIDDLGGVVPAIEQGYFQKRIADSAYVYEQALASNSKIIVGVNAFRSDEEPQHSVPANGPGRRGATTRAPATGARRSRRAPRGRAVWRGLNAPPMKARTSCRPDRRGQRVRDTRRNHQLLASSVR